MTDGDHLLAQRAKRTPAPSGAVIMPHRPAIPRSKWPRRHGADRRPRLTERGRLRGSWLSNAPVTRREQIATAQASEANSFSCRVIAALHHGLGPWDGLGRQDRAIDHSAVAVSSLQVSPGMNLARPSWQLTAPACNLIAAASRGRIATCNGQ